MINFYTKPTGSFDRAIYICQISDVIERWAILGKPCDPSKSQKYGYIVYVAPFNWQAPSNIPFILTQVANNRAIGMPFGTRAWTKSENNICCQGDTTKDFRPCCHYRWYPWKFKMPVGWGSWGSWSSCDKQCKNVRYRKCMGEKGQCKVFWSAENSTPWKDVKACSNSLCGENVRSPFSTRPPITTRKPYTTRRIWNTQRPTTRKIWTTRRTTTTRWTIAQATRKNSPLGWTWWTSWTECSRTCGGGVQYRERSCEDGCQKNHRSGKFLTWHQEPRGCGLTQCAPGHRSRWGIWQSWERCDQECGRGMQNRWMSCSSGACKNDPPSSYPSQSKPCYLKQHCPAWNSWDNWGTCNALCGGGRQTRLRTCKTGKPGFEGCPGADFENQQCNAQGCSQGEARYADQNQYGMPRTTTPGLSLSPFHQECLDYHNFFRALHNLKPMKAPGSNLNKYVINNIEIWYIQLVISCNRFVCLKPVN